MDELGNGSEFKQDAKDVRNERCVGVVSFSDQMNQVMDAGSSLPESDTSLSYSGAPRVDYKYSSSKVCVATDSTATANYPNRFCTFSTQNLLTHESNNTQTVWYGHFYRIYYFFVNLYTSTQLCTNVQSFYT